MSDTLAGLFVNLDGDGSGAEKAIKGVASELAALDKAANKAQREIDSTGKISHKTAKRMAKLSEESGGYREIVNQSKKTLDDNRVTLEKAEKAYKKNSDAVSDQRKQHKQLASETKKQVTAQKEKIKGFEEENKSLDVNSKAYKNNCSEIKKSQKQIQELTDKRKESAKSLRQNENRLKVEEAQLKNNRSAVNSAAKRYEFLASNIKEVERQEKALELKERADAWKDVGDGLDTVTKPVQNLALLTAAGGIAAAKFAIDFEDSFAAVKKTVNDGTTEELEAIKQGIIDLSTVGINGRNAIPLTTTELNELASAAGQLGVEAENVVEFTEVTAQMGTATNLVGAEGASTMARFLNVMGLGNNVVRNLGSTLVDLGNNSATTEAEIAEMALRLGKFGATVDIGAADVLGYSAALSSMGIEAQAGGSAVGRTWLAIETAVAEGGSALTAFAKYSGKSAKEFAAQWSSDSSGAFNDLLSGMKAGTEQGQELVTMLSELGINNTLDQQAMMALVNGFDKTAESVERANRAWEENSALQKEFDAKAETTASQLSIMKNNLVETARGVGELLLPDIVQGTNGIKNFAQSLARMDEGQKKAVIGTGKFVIGAGVAAKATVGVVKGTAEMTEAFSKLKEHGGIPASLLAKLAPAMTAVGSAALPVAAGVAAVGIAAVVAKKSYDAWYDSNYRFAEGLEEGNAVIEEHTDKLQTLEDAQAKIESAKLVIKNEKSSQEDVEKAKTQIKEIADLLAEEYDLHINVDAPDLENTAEEVENTVKALTQGEWNEQQRSFNTQIKDLTYSRKKSDNRAEEIAQWKKEREEATKNYGVYDKLNTQLDTLRMNYRNNAINQEEYVSGLEDIAKTVGISSQEIERLKDISLTQFDSEVGNQLAIDLRLAKKAMEAHKGEIENYEASLAKLKEEATSTANQLIENSGRYADSGMLDQFFINMRSAIEAGELDLVGYAETVQNTLSGMSLETAIKSGGNDLTKWVNDFINVGKELGGNLPDIISKAALFANGFKDAESVTAESIPNIIATMQQLGEADGIELSSKALTDMARSLNLIPENKEIKINAEGVVEVVDAITETEKKTTELDGKTTTLEVNAENKATGTIDEITTELSQVPVNTEVVLSANGEQATAVINGVSYNIVAYDSLTGTAYLGADNTGAIAAYNTASGALEIFDVKIATADLKANNLTQEGVSDALSTLSQLPITKTINIVVSGAKKIGEWVKGNFAKGTSDFQGGLAMINDEKGVSDPRELVEVGGQGYIFEGRDVVLPLPEHAKVYTAGQTQKILSSMAIPRYASGKNNDAWANAKDELSHRQKTSYIPMSSAEMFKWIDEMKSRFANNIEAMQELDEMFVETAMDSWDEYIDNLKYQLDMGEISEKEYYEALENYRDEYIEVGSDKYKEVTLDIHKYNEEVKRDTIETANEVSKAWIENRAKLNDWNELSDSMGAAYSRIMERNAAALNEGTITWEEYLETGNKTFESLLSGYIGYSDEWISQQKNYSAMSAQEEKAAIERQRAELDKLKANLGELTEEQWIIYLEASAKLDKNYMDASAREVEEWRSDADFYQQQSNVYGWDWLNAEDSAVKYWERRLEEEIKNSQNEELSANERNIALRKADEARMEIYQAREAELDEALDTFRTEIDETRETLNKKVSDLRASWTVEDRQEDMSDIAKQMSIYENAVTKEGRDKYKSLQEEYKNLQREEQVYQMETENNATLEELEAEYEQMEKENATTLKNLKADLTTANSQQYTVLTESLTQAKNVAGTATEMKESLDNGIFVLGNIHKSIIDLSEAVNGLKSLSNRPLNISAGAASNANWLSSTRYNYPY